MSYYDLPEDFLKRTGIDYDLSACLEYNPQDGFTLEDIAKVLAVHEGERDEEDWRWVLQLNDGRFVFLQGGCDYTGWDCQSSANRAFFSTAEEAANGEVGRWQKNTPEIKAELLAQITESKSKTWREGKDSEFNIFAS